MFVRVIPNNKGKKKTYFCDLVESFRDKNGAPKHRVVVKLGQFDQDHFRIGVKEDRWFCRV